MSEVKYGELASWDDADVGGPSDFMNLAEGDNKIRVLTKPYQFVVHWVRDVSGKNRKIKCAFNNCPLCKQKIPSQTRWYIGVLDYKSGRPKILEIGTSILRGIRGYVNNPDWSDKFDKSWGKIMAYDINITRGPKGSPPASLYQVMPSPKMKDITKKETEMVEEFLSKVNIAKFTQPPTPEEIEEKVGGAVLPSQYSESQSNTTTSSGRKSSAKGTVDDSEFEFGDEELN